MTDDERKSASRQLAFLTARAGMQDIIQTAAASNQDVNEVVASVWALAYVLLRNRGVTREAMLRAATVTERGVQPDPAPVDITPPGDKKTVH